MANCIACRTKMGYTESNVARDYDGMCVACYVKSLVKTKVQVANSDRKPSNVKSIDNYFSKFENLLITSEQTTSSRVKKRYGIVHGEATFTGNPHGNKTLFNRLFTRKEDSRDFRSLRNIIEEADIELKANAIKLGANTIVGYQLELTNYCFGKDNYVIAVVSGTALETA